MTPTGRDVRAMSAFLSFLRHSSVDGVVRVSHGSSDGPIVDRCLDIYEGDMAGASRTGTTFPLRPGMLSRLRGLRVGLPLPGDNFVDDGKVFCFVMDQFTLRVGVPAVDLLVSVSSSFDCLYQHISSEWFSFLLFPSHIPPPHVMQLPRCGGIGPQIMTFESPDSCLKTSYLRLSPPQRGTFVPAPSLRSRPLVVVCA